MKLWLDDLRPAPEGYVWCKSVKEAKHRIVDHEVGIPIIEEKAKWLEKAGYDLEARDYRRAIPYLIIELLDLDHDLGDYAHDGGDGVRLLDWLEETGRNYPIHIHSQNSVGVANMRRIIEKNGWKEVF